MLQDHLLTAWIAEAHILKFNLILPVKALLHGNGSCGMLIFHLHQFQEIRHVVIGPLNLRVVPGNTLKSSRQLHQGSRILGKCAYGDGACQHLHSHEQVTEYGEKAISEIRVQYSPGLHIAHILVKPAALFIPFCHVVHQHPLHIVHADHFCRLQVHHDSGQQIIQLHFHPRMILEIFFRIFDHSGRFRGPDHHDQSQEQEHQSHGDGRPGGKSKQRPFCPWTAEAQHADHPRRRPDLQKPCQQPLVICHDTAQSSVHGSDALRCENLLRHLGLLHGLVIQGGCLLPHHHHKSQGTALGRFCISLFHQLGCRSQDKPCQNRHASPEKSLRKPACKQGINEPGRQIQVQVSGRHLQDRIDDPQGNGGRIHFMYDFHQFQSCLVIFHGFPQLF